MDEILGLNDELESLREEFRAVECESAILERTQLALTDSFSLCISTRDTLRFEFIECMEACNRTESLIGTPQSDLLLAYVAKCETEISRLTVELSKTRESELQLVLSIEKCDDELSLFELESAELISAITERTGTHNKASDSYEKASLQRVDLLERIHFEGKRMRDLDLEKETLHNRKNSFASNDHRELKRASLSIQTEREELIQQIKSLGGVLETQQSRIDGISLMIQESTHRISEVHSELTSNRKNLGILSKQNNDLLRLEHAQNSQNANTRKLIDATSMRIESIDDELRVTVKGIQELQRLTKTCAAERNRYEQDLEIQTNTLYELSRKLSRAQDACKAVDRKVKARSLSNDRLRRTIGSLKTEIAGIASNRPTIDVIEIRTRLELSGKEIDQYKRELQKLENTTTRNANESNRVNESADHVLRSCKHVQHRIDGLERLDAAQRAEMATLAAGLDSQSSIISTLKTELIKLSSDRDHVLSALRADEAQVAQKQNELRNIHKRIEINKALIGSKNGEKARLETCLTDVLRSTCELATRLDQISDLKQKLNEIRLQLKSERLLIHQTETLVTGKCNIHRWTLLLETNPDLFSDVRHLHTLQAELLRTQKAIVCMQEKLRIKQDLISEMRKLDRPDFRDKVKQVIQFYRHQREELHTTERDLDRERARLESIVGQVFVTQDQVNILTTGYIRQRMEGLQISP